MVRLGDEKQRVEGLKPIAPTQGDGNGISAATLEHRHPLHAGRKIPAFCHPKVEAGAHIDPDGPIPYLVNRHAHQRVDSPMVVQVKEVVQIEVGIDRATRTAEPQNRGFDAQFVGGTVTGKGPQADDGSVARIGVEAHARAKAPSAPLLSLEREEDREQKREKQRTNSTI